MRNSALHFLIALLLLLHSLGARAFSFVPEPSEFRTWPEFCKAKYVTSSVGFASQFSTAVPQAIVDKWRSANMPWWEHIHHGCASLIWIRRAERLEGKDKTRFNFALGQTQGEAHFSIMHTPSSDPMHWLLQSVIARETFLRGQRDEAIALLQNAAREAPQVEEVHAALGVLLYKLNRLPDALKALQDGLKEIKEPSAEINYLTGFVLARMERYAEAEPYAVAAYKQGYPAPWLRNRLRSHGFLKSSR